MPRAVIGIGSNLGDSRATVVAAFAALAAIDGVRELARSELYLTAPVGGPPQGAYVNAAVAVETAIAPGALLAALLAIELAFGRTRGEPNAPRTLDLDLLWIEGVSIEAPGIRVPHPRLRERAFALRPLVDVAPDATDPGTGEPYGEALRRIGMTGVEPLDPRSIHRRLDPR